MQTMSKLRVFCLISLGLFLFTGAAQASIVFDDFNTNEGHFATSPTFSGTSNVFLCSSSTISALADMFARSSPEALSMDTLTSKLTTLSFSTPRGEICVTRPSNRLSLNVSTLMRAG